MKQRSKKKGDSPSNVVFLSRYQSPAVTRAITFYLSEKAQCLDVLHTDPGLRVLDIRSLDELRRQEAHHTPEIILIESSVTWADPMQLIQSLETRYRVPIIFICKGRNSTGKNRKTVKDAYAAGACDTLFTPLEKEELFAAVDVLLKFQQRQTLYH